MGGFTATRPLAFACAKLSHQRIKPPIDISLQMDWCCCAQTVLCILCSVLVCSGSCTVGVLGGGRTRFLYSGLAWDNGGVGFCRYETLTLIVHCNSSWTSKSRRPTLKMTATNPHPTRRRNLSWLVQAGNGVWSLVTFPGAFLHFSSSLSSSPLFFSISLSSVQCHSFHC